jgi:hypothetical protein
LGNQVLVVVVVEEEEEEDRHGEVRIGEQTLLQDDYKLSIQN